MEKFCSLGKRSKKNKTIKVRLDSTNNDISISCSVDKQSFNYTNMASCTCIIIRVYLETNGLYDKKRLIAKQENGDYSIPIILNHAHSKDDTHSKSHSIDPKSCSIDLKSCSIDLKSMIIDPETLLKDHPLLTSCELIVDGVPSFTKKQVSDIEIFIETVLKIIENIDHLLNQEDKELLPSFLSQLPFIKIHRVSDLVLLSKGGSTHELWDTLQTIYPSIWTEISQSIHCNRIALSSSIKPNGYRSPNTRLVLGDSGWVEQVDNGVKYVFDVTQCMFSKGNITEKIRMSSLDCRGETVVDLYAGKSLYK